MCYFTLIPPPLASFPLPLFSVCTFLPVDHRKSIYLCIKWIHSFPEILCVRSNGKMFLKQVLLSLQLYLLHLSDLVEGDLDVLALEGLQVGGQLKQIFRLRLIEK